jgi:hypothetical protein
MCGILAILSSEPLEINDQIKAAILQFRGSNNPIKLSPKYWHKQVTVDSCELEYSI